MNKRELLFYDAYEDFYTMAESSRVFQAYCIDAFGEDFSQDGFSDRKQVDLILPYIPFARFGGHSYQDGENPFSPHKPTEYVADILDIGCGNGKMLGYLQRRTGASIHGFDYSEQAIKTARKLFSKNAEFQVGVIGNIDYPEEKFDVIISMDTMYFARDMALFVTQIKKWLKRDGVFFVGYQEGDVMPRTSNAENTVLASALVHNGMEYEVTDITRQTYELLAIKRKAAMKFQAAFEAEGQKKWFDMLMGQTECVTEPYEQFKERMARYIYVVRK